VVAEVLRQKRQRMPEDQRATEELYDEARLDVLDGDFARAEARLGEALARVTANDSAEAHARYAGTRVALLLGAGLDRQAAAVAAEHLAREAAWMRASSPAHFVDPTVLMLRARRRAGAIDAAEFASRRDAWLADARARKGTLSETAVWV